MISQLAARPGRRAVPAMLAALLPMAAMLALVAGPAQAALQPARNTPVAGTISEFAGGVGGPGPASSVSIAACGVASVTTACSLTFGAGHLYVSDIGENGENSPNAGNVVRAIDLRTGQLTTPVGDGVTGVAGDGDTAIRPAGVAVDSTGNLLVADSHNSRVLVLAARTGTFYGVAMTAGGSYPVAGDGTAGPLGDGGPALSAELDGPEAVTLDRAGNLVIADNGEYPFGAPSAVRVVAVKTGVFYGQQMTAGDIYKVAGRSNGSPVTGDGGPASKAFLGGGIGPVLVDSAGNLVIADTATNGIRVVAAQAGTFYGEKMKAHDIYTVAGGGSDGDRNGVPAVRAGFIAPDGLAIDGSGNLVITDTAGNVLRVVAIRTGRFYHQKMKAADIYTVAGGGTSLLDGALATKARLSHPRAVAVDSSGNLVVADAFARKLRVLAARSGTFYGTKMTFGHVYTFAGNGGTWLSGDGGRAAHAQLFPSAVALDQAGNLLVADSASRAGRSVVRLVAAKAGTFYGQPMIAGDIYTVAGAGPEAFSGDGGPARKAGFQLSTRSGQQGALAVDAAGNLMIGDAGNNRLRVVAVKTETCYGQKMKAGDIYTVAGGGGNPGTDGLGDGGPATAATLNTVDGEGVAVDSSGNLVISDSENNLVRVVAAKTGTFYGVPMKTGDIYVVAGGGNPATGIGDGGPGTHARVNLPGGIVVDPAGNLVIVDRDDDGRLRVLAATTGTYYGVPMTAGDIYTVAGGGSGPDGGPAIGAAIGPANVAVDAAGNLIVTSTGFSRIRVVAVTTGTFYGVPMTAGDVYTVAGNGTFGFSGDGRPAVTAQLWSPEDAVVDKAGDIIVADSGNFRLRVVRR